jgi:mono/diheme cytochrome c family protein
MPDCHCLDWVYCADERCSGRRAARGGSEAYQIVDGKVDKRTYNGFRRYNAVCNHCHGPDGVGGSFGPSLIEAPPDRLLVL